MGRHGPSHGGAGLSMKEKQSHVKLFLRTLPYIWPEGEWALKLRVVAAVLLLLLSKVLELAVPFMLARTVDDLVKVKDGQKKAALSSVLTSILLYGIFRFLAGAVGELKNIVFAHVAAHTERTVALMTFRHLQNLSLRFHLTRKTGAVLRSVSRGASSFATITRILLFQISPVFMQVVVVCSFLFAKYDWFFAVITFFTIFFYFMFTFATTEWRNKFRRYMNQKDNDFNQKAVDALLNFETVKYFNAEAHETQRFDKSLQEYKKANIVSSQSLALLNAGQAFVISIGVMTAMVLAGKQAVDGELSVGDFVLINQFILTLYLPLGFLGTYYRMLKQNLIDVESMFAITSEPIEVQDKDDAGEMDVKEGAISFRNVTFGYSEDETILDNVSFDVKPGQSVAIVGKSGAGKSTLARLLYRFYDVQKGSIQIDGQDIKDVSQYSLRRHIAIVPQDCVLFNDTIGYNVNYGRVGVGEEDDKNAVDVEDYKNNEEVIQAAQSASIHEFIKSQKDGYDTQVGERGLRLSGGEKQRVAIARAILKKPRIIIFDEATSSLDTHTERDIQAALDRVSRGRSSLTIAHRLSTIVDCDRIIVLKNGKIAEQGTHDELVAIDNGVYKGMWERQQRDAQLKRELEAIREVEDEESKVEEELVERKEQADGVVVDDSSDEVEQQHEQVEVVVETAVKPTDLAPLSIEDESKKKPE